jgi:putative endonuclease
MNTTDIGRLGELVAASYLSMRELDVLERRFSCLRGEVDIVARDGDVFAFVEVKLRGPRAKGPGRAAVNAAKQERIVRAALAYLADHGGTAQRMRFDVIEIDLDGNGLRLTHLRDAFRPALRGGRWSSCWRRS